MGRLLTQKAPHFKEIHATLRLLPSGGDRLVVRSPLSVALSVILCAGAFWGRGWVSMNRTTGRSTASFSHKKLCQDRNRRHQIIGFHRLIGVVAPVLIAHQ